MKKSKDISFLAIDLGASSGRAILGRIDNEKLSLRELRRFSNPIIEVNGRQYWDLLFLYEQVIASLKEIRLQQLSVKSIGIDTWGVDFVCFDKEGEPVGMPYSYRDTRTSGALERFFRKMTKKEVYQKTGIQIMNFNTLFQLDTLLTEKKTILPLIDKILFMPDALSYMLTGKMVTEYTITSTSQMLNPYSREMDESLLEAIGLTKKHFAPMIYAGETIGDINPSVQHLTGLKELTVVAVAGHDTASAVLAVPASNRNFAYLSSGTWSLMGIETEDPIINEETYRFNITNEGGADGTIRLLKNICGMWLIERCRKEWAQDHPISYDEIVSAAEQSEPFKCFINPDASCFINPASMIGAIREYCRKTNQFVPLTIGEIARVIYESLAFRYKQVLDNLQTLAAFPIETLHIIGGGSKNQMLNIFTANAIGIPVIAGPSEATAIGNLLLQAKAAGVVKNKEEIRRLVRNSVELEIFKPVHLLEWEKYYGQYLRVFHDEIPK
ncbi:MAG: rhamnulokinase [Proteiniphilum sp.]|jgi:rhamnulokinase|nr:rhamnulokinase [Proteiniphilum sp.]MDD3332687.1 rhamnulokinase [Proteiniphilum sp.]MDD3556311.1 rhamnulokinase [Proteiniphilum sp.]MDD3980237.1 rhamnulokinase [Proteiniphilum sp.]MDD5346449.1 rhamnulokinase [Proteiniphilum sp.]